MSAQPLDEKEPAPFDDSRKALVFALNAHQVTVPTAYMNKAMAAVKFEAKRKSKALKALHDAEEAFQAQKRSYSLARISTPPLRGLNAAHQAGVILFHFRRLDAIHQTVLTGLLTKAYLPCLCRRPCCSGWTPTERWVEAVRQACETIRTEADILRAPGRKGLSSQPGLREALVKQYFTKNERTITDLAERAGVTAVTAARHKEWVYGWMEQTEAGAWAAIEPILDQAGITGPHL
jgi:hypothetical protein